MKPKAESVTHTSFSEARLSEAARNEILRILESKGHHSENVDKFVKAVDESIVHAYVLSPSMSTRGERREWFAKVSKATKSLMDLLAEADSARGDVSKWMSEDLERIDTVLCEYFGRECGPHVESLIVPALRRLADEADTQAQRLGVSRKSPGPQQQLANHIALAWSMHLGKRPTASTSTNRYTGYCSPFIDVLRIAIESVEFNQTGDLAKLAERAIAWLKKQDEHAGNSIPK